MSKIFAPDLLKGKVCLVSGGGTGLGRAATLELARLGATVVICEMCIRDRIERQSDAFYTSGRLLDDAVIDPRDSRRALAFFLQTVNEERDLTLRPLSFGVARL